MARSRATAHVKSNLQFLLYVRVDEYILDTYILRMKEEEQEYVSTSFAARLLGVSQEAVSQNIRKGNIPAIRIGRNWAVRREDLKIFAGSYVKGPGPRKRREP